jgi:hypothetical protein
MMALSLAGKSIYRALGHPSSRTAEPVILSLNQDGTLETASRRTEHMPTPECNSID